jgi:hypothetical protein
MASAGDCSRFQLSHWLLQLPGRPPHQGSLSEGRIPGRTLGNGLLLEYVYLEVITVLLTRAGAAVAVKAGSDLLESKEFEFVPCSELFAETVRNSTLNNTRS